jgi:hypothetical protein
MLFSLVSVAMLLNVAAVNATELRRPISPSSPLWLIHIDTWNSPDPERIIEMVPEDIRPFVCFNISLSATDATCCSGPDVCDSWLKACAEKRVWCMIQPASGSHNRFSDTDFSCYEKYFKQYPNFIGWNFAEQFWGFGDTGQPTFDQRLNTFVHILDYCQQYGGYLVVVCSVCMNYGHDEWRIRRWSMPTFRSTHGSAFPKVIELPSQLALASCVSTRKCWMFWSTSTPRMILIPMPPRPDCRGAMPCCWNSSHYWLNCRRQRKWFCII